MSISSWIVLQRWGTGSSNRRSTLLGDADSEAAEVLGLLAKGCLYKEIADRLDIIELVSKLSIHLDARDCLDVFRHVRDGGRHVRHSLDGECHIVRGQLRAVGECHAVAQLELPCGIIDQPP